MKVKIRTPQVRFSLPVPAAMIGFVVKRLPDSLFTEIRGRTPAPYDCLITKETARMVLEACQDLLKENKGLEILHVEETDGTYISIKL